MTTTGEFEPLTETYYRTIATELGVQPHQVAAAADLLTAGATVPFIARYRKEATGSLDEVSVSTVRDRLEQLAELDKRRQAVLRSLAERELLTEDLRDKLQAAATLTEVEDIYLPFRPKRRTRATIAHERGLEPLARWLLAQDGGMDSPLVATYGATAGPAAGAPAASTAPSEPTSPPVALPARPAATPAELLAAAAAFVDTERGVPTAEDALAGARDIIAEWVNEDAAARARLRLLFSHRGAMVSHVGRGKKEEGVKFRDYFDWQEPASTAPSHRVLAMLRGEKEGFLVLRVEPPEEEALPLLEQQFVTGRGPASEQVRLATEDSYRRYWDRHWRRKPAWNSNVTPTKKPSASSPPTCASCCWRPLWDRRPSWRWTRASAPAVSWPPSMPRGTCWSTTPSSPTNRNGCGRPRVNALFGW